MGAGPGMNLRTDSDDEDDEDDIYRGYNPYEQ